jgi:fatty acyl-CoA reductase
MERISEFYAGKCILITGTTGFVGKCVLEKVLRDLPCISSIFLLIRPKKGKILADRVNIEIVQSPIFTRLRQETEHFEDFFWSKVIPVAGDIGLDGLGISQDDQREISSRTNILINCKLPFRHSHS